jgi:hypothetical protein
MTDGEGEYSMTLPVKDMPSEQTETSPIRGLTRSSSKQRRLKFCHSFVHNL